MGCVDNPLRCMNTGTPESVRDMIRLQINLKFKILMYNIMKISLNFAYSYFIIADWTVPTSETIH
jgi:hypothetical protein